LGDDLREGSGLREERESMVKKESAEKAVREIRRKTRRRLFRTFANRADELAEAMEGET
jgi:hypothetical protein